MVGGVKPREECPPPQHGAHRLDAILARARVRVERGLV